METYENDPKYYRARKKVRQIKGFYGNLGSYLIVNTFFLILNLMTTPEHLWFYWPMLGWGLGVLFHALRVFDIMPFFGKEWERKKIRELMEAEARNRNENPS